MYSSFLGELGHGKVVRKSLLLSQSIDAAMKKSCNQIACCSASASLALSSLDSKIT